MDASGSTDWTYWQRAILFGVQADSPETYKVIISWISGALLPLVALGMTALVADNIRLATGRVNDDEDDSISKERADEIVENEVQKRLTEIKKKEKEYKPKLNLNFWRKPIKQSTEMVGDALTDRQERPGIIKDAKTLDLDDNKSDIDYVPLKESASDLVLKAEKEIEERWKAAKEKSAKENPENKLDLAPSVKPVNKIRGWHFSSEYVDDEHNVFNKGKWIGKDVSKTPTSKKA